MLGIITGTINPNASMGQLIVRNEDERLKQYIEGLVQVIESKAFSKIVFCENSNYGVEKMEVLYDLARENSALLELISFQGNEEKCRFHGKGYGEGEILKYVLENSTLACDEDYFVKITGRMKVMNISEIVSRLKNNKTYFNVPNHTCREFYDTRIYAMPIARFKTCFIDAYRKVKDNEGVFLEHVYTEVLRENRIKVTNFPRYPRIIGVSGSTGMQYVYTEWKCKVKDILSFFGFYSVETR